MSLAYTLAQRIRFGKGDGTQRVSPPAVRIAIAGVAIGVAVMLCTVAIVVGFKDEVRQKVIDFGGHLQVQTMVRNRTYELSPLAVNDTLAEQLTSVPGITQLCGEVTKPAVLKTDSDFVSVVMKGSQLLYPPVMEAQPAAEAADGEEPEDDAEEPEDDAADERQVALSRTIADKLRLKVGDDVTAYFVQTARDADLFALGAEQTQVKVRRLKVGSVYETHFSEIDRQMVLTTVGLLQGVNGWEDDTYSTLALRIDDYERLDDLCYRLDDMRLTEGCGTPLIVRTVEDLNPQVFGWLALLDTNVWVILILIAAVAAFTMISGLLIVILERTQMIGILKALGMDDRRLRGMFLWVALRLTGRGLLWGNVIGLGLCWVQSHWHVLKLDPENYYLEWVPIALSPTMVVLVNVGTVLITLLVLVGPTSLVARISPARTLASEHL